MTGRLFRITLGVRGAAASSRREMGQTPAAQTVVLGDCMTGADHRRSGRGIRIPNFEELPRRRFLGGDENRRQASAELQRLLDKAGQATGPEELARLLPSLDDVADAADRRASVNRGHLEARGAVWARHGRSDHPDVRGALREYSGLAEVYAAHARNVRRLRDEVCRMMMEAL